MMRKSPCIPTHAHNCTQQKLKKYRAIVILSIIAISQVAFANPSTIQIGDNVFRPTHKKLVKKLPYRNYSGQIGNSYFRSLRPKAKVISQVGAAIEERQTNALLYAFVNQLFPNEFYYEARAYAIYHYISQNPPIVPSGSTPIPISSEHNPIGYGGVGIVGYNLKLSPDVSLLPFIRLQALANTIAAYEDSFGNKINSVSYSSLLGGKLSLRVTDTFAVYVQYYGGYQYDILSGRGIYSNKGNPRINALTSTIEFGTPYKINKTVSVTPYIQLATAGSNPNQAARSEPYSVTQLTRTDTVFAIKVGYAF